MRYDPILNINLININLYHIRYTDQTCEYCFQMDTPRSDDLSMTSMQVVELKRKLDEERDGYRRKLQSYQEGQQRQAQLVQKLQSKVCFISN